LNNNGHRDLHKAIRVPQGLLALPLLQSEASRAKIAALQAKMKGGEDTAKPLSVRGHGLPMAAGVFIYEMTRTSNKATPKKAKIHFWHSLWFWDWEICFTCLKPKGHITGFSIYTQLKSANHSFFGVNERPPTMGGRWGKYCG